MMDVVPGYVGEESHPGVVQREAADAIVRNPHVTRGLNPRRGTTSKLRNNETRTINVPPEILFDLSTRNRL